MQVRHPVRQTRLNYIARRTLMTSLLAAWIGAAQAAGPINIDIPPQPLASALAKFAEQSGIKATYPAELLAGKNAPRIEGNLTPQQALDKLLSGSGLRYQFVSPDAVKIEVAPAPQSKEETMLPAVEVRGAILGSVGYKAKKAISATKTDTPVMETPVSVQTVTNEVITDRRYTRLQEALENVGGVVAVPTLGVGSRYMVRGFRQDRIYRDGLQSNGLNAAFPTDYDTATAESIEVVKGPASVLYGRIEPGGLINITTKKPQAVSQHSIGVEAGSFGFRRAEADSTGRLGGEDSKLLYRLVATLQKSNTFKDFGQDDRIVFAPSLTWQPAASTDLRVSMEYFQRDFQSEYGTPVIGDRPVKLPRERSFSDPNDPMDQITRFQISTDLNHKLNDDWTLRHRFLSGDLKSKAIFINPTPAFGNALQADGRTLNRNIFGQSSDSVNYSTNLDIVGNLDLGGMKHQILAGMDYLQGRTHYYLGGDWQNPNPALSIDIYNPSYGIAPALFNTAMASYIFPASSHSVFKDNVLGLYLQDQIKVTEKWQVLIGGRNDRATTGRGPGTSEAAAEAAVPKRKDSAFSPRLAALYRFHPDLSTYASWSRSFGANNGISATGGTFDPQQGEQYELGLKAELFEQRLFANMSLYHLTKSNLLTPDLSTPNPNDSIAVGEQRARGIELDLSGRVIDRFNVTASYAHTVAEVTRDNSGLLGKQINNMPRNMLSLWGRYDFPSGLNIGLGGVAVDNRPGDLANTFTLPGYARVDAMASYAFKMGGQALTVQLNVRNLLDRYYFESCDPSLNVAPRLGVAVGAPRAVNASLKMEF